MEGGNGESLLNRGRVSEWGDEKVLEVSGADGYIKAVFPVLLSTILLVVILLFLLFSMFVFTKMSCLTLTNPFIFSFHSE